MSDIWPCQPILVAAESIKGKRIDSAQLQLFLDCLYNAPVTESNNSRLERVLAQLRLYEHPLLEFSARAKGDGVELIIQFKNPPAPVHTYYFDLHSCDLDNSQFEWNLQRQLYDCLHDYLVEMFIRTPQDRIERQRESL